MAEHKRVSTTVQHRVVGHLAIVDLGHTVELSGEWQKDRVENYQIEAVKKAARQEVGSLATKLRRELSYDIHVVAESRTIITYEETLRSVKDLALVSDSVEPSWSSSEIVTVSVPSRSPLPF